MASEGVTEEAVAQEASLCYRLIVLAITVVIVVFARRYRDGKEEKAKILETIKKKQREREAQFRQIELVHPWEAAHEDITSLSPEELIDKLQKRELKAVEVLRAFTAKAVKVQRSCNCITEFVPDAEEWAKDLDASPEVRGPLHGLPISIKDNLGIKGMDSTLGLGKHLYKPFKDHSIIIKTLLDLGAVPFCKTNVPQTLFSFECSNPIFGTTTNPLNSKLTSGGSSGGEGALIAAGGSFVGIGSDIGGSVRIPAHYCGVSSLKPSNFRISPNGFNASMPNVVGVTGVPGIMGKSTAIIEKVFRHMVEDNNQNKRDALCPPIPLNEAKLAPTKKLRIGYFTSVECYPPIGDTESVVLEAKKALEDQGHTLVPFHMPDNTILYKLIVDFLYGEGGYSFVDAWKHEPISPEVAGGYQFCSMPRPLRWLLAWYFEKVKKSPNTAMVLNGGAMTTKGLWQCIGGRRKYLNEIINQWKEQDLDFVLSPVFPYPALPIGYGGSQAAATGYTINWNMFDFPCGTIPFGYETGKNIDNYKAKDPMHQAAKQGIRQSIGMPISVQLIALPYEDEKILGGMKILEGLAKRKASE